MKRIAILINEDFSNRKGSFNATHARILNFIEKAKEAYEVDVYCISIYEPWYVRMLHNGTKISRPKEQYLDGILYHMIYFRFLLLDYVLRMKFNKDRFLLNLYLKTLVPKFAKYDLIIAHSYLGGCLASMIKAKFNIPYTVTWHGSDIHSAPFNNNVVYDTVKKILDSADMNFFVSQNLLETSNKISSTSKKIVLYNGVNRTKFYPYVPQERLNVKSKFNIQNNVRNIAFIGNLLAVKNVLTLPLIFKKIYDNIGDVNFHFVGDGKFRHYLEIQCSQYKLPVRFWGNMSPDVMPNVINCMDLVVLPSKNEGLPLIVVESLACGVSVVGAKVGGIPEVLDSEFCISHGNNFEERFANTCLKAMAKEPQTLSSKFSWETTAHFEFLLVKTLLC